MMAQPTAPNPWYKLLNFIYLGLICSKILDGKLGMIKSSTKMAGSHDLLGKSIVVFNYLDVKQKQKQDTLQ